jgi:uncharacterized protein (DUF433 family)
VRQDAGSGYVVDDRGRLHKLKIGTNAAVVAVIQWKETTVEIAPPPVIEIERNPKRCGGNPTLAGTRTTVHDVVANVRLYDGDIERMVEDFPHLTVEVVEAILAWYQEHKEEIDGILRRRCEEYQRLLAESRAGR